MTRPKSDVEAARGLIAAGHSIAETARQVGVARATVRDWMTKGFAETTARRFIEKDSAGRCAFCRYVRDLTEPTSAYLLGLYLGDGTISHCPRGVYKLRIFQDLKYPVLIRECMVAMQWVVWNRVGVTQRNGCKEIYSYSQHWPCLFPQHGPGMKHNRSIVLEPWQRWVAIERHPKALLRGLVHSDGCRATNRVRVRGKDYAYPRYQFSNRSADIRRIFTDACDRAAIEWRQSYEWTISISKRSSVEDMDRFIGPKS